MTDAEINEAAARAMGYTKRTIDGLYFCAGGIAEGESSEIWDVGGGRQIDCAAWNPCSNLEQAFMVQERTQELGRWSHWLSRLCEMKPLEMNQGWWLAHAAPARARTAAAVEAMREGG